MSDSKTWSIDRVLNKTHFHGKHMKKMCTKQGFSQVLRTWGWWWWWWGWVGGVGSSKFDGGGGGEGSISQKKGGA